MERSNIIESSGFYFIHNFDSGNLGHVERVPTELIGKVYFIFFKQSPMLNSYNSKLFARHLSLSLLL